MLTVVPCPGLLRIVAVPPDCLANPYTWLKPRPVPLPTPLVVKNGSNTRGSVSAAMPAPVSVSSTRHEVAAQAVDLGLAGQPDLAHRDRENAAIRHRVARIHAEVQQRELELARVDADAARSVLRRCPDPDVAAQRPLEHLG